MRLPWVRDGALARCRCGRANGMLATANVKELRATEAAAEEEEAMERVAIVVRLKEGSGAPAAELIAAGPPFDLEGSGIVRHSVYLAAGEVIFVFEGHQVEWMVDDLISDPSQFALQRTFDQWRSIVDGSPRIARELFGWDAKVESPPAEAMTGW